jgi:hypothetical protein
MDSLVKFAFTPVTFQYVEQPAYTKQEKQQNAYSHYKDMISIAQSFTLYLLYEMEKLERQNRLAVNRTFVERLDVVFNLPGVGWSLPGSSAVEALPSLKLHEAFLITCIQLGITECEEK